ncbi:MAG: Nif3-like dinuclear metal center hexameric protein [Faecalibacterium sp.]
MTTIDSIYQEMQRIAPLALAESWDNPGLLVDCGGGASRVLVTLDITPEVVKEAARKGCQLIVSHHPVIFSPPQEAGRAGRGLSAGEKRHLGHLYAHESGCRRGRRQ